MGVGLGSVDGAIARLSTLRAQADSAIAIRDPLPLIDIARTLRDEPLGVDTTALRRKVQIVGQRLSEGLPHAQDVVPMQRAFDQARAGLDLLKDESRATAEVEAMVASRFGSSTTKQRLDWYENTYKPEMGIR